jgi:hypothetical protein
MIELPRHTTSNGMENILPALSDSPSLEAIFVPYPDFEVAYRAVATSESIKYIGLIMSPHAQLSWEWQWQSIQDLMADSVIQFVVTDGT